MEKYNFEPWLPIAGDVTVLVPDPGFRENLDLDRALSYHPQPPQAIWDPGINCPWSGNSQPWGHVHLGNCKVVAASFWEMNRLELLGEPGMREWESKCDSSPEI